MASTYIPQSVYIAGTYVTYEGRTYYTPVNRLANDPLPAFPNTTGSGWIPQWSETDSHAIGTYVEYQDSIHYKNGSNTAAPNVNNPATDGWICLWQAGTQYNKGAIVLYNSSMFRASQTVQSVSIAELAGSIESLSVQQASSSSLNVSFTKSGSAIQQIQVIVTDTATSAQTATVTVSAAAAMPVAISGLQTQTTAYTVRATPIGSNGMYGSTVSTSYTPQPTLIGSTPTVKAIARYTVEVAATPNISTAYVSLKLRPTATPTFGPERLIVLLGGTAQVTDLDADGYDLQSQTIVAQITPVAQDGVTRGSSVDVNVGMWPVINANDAYPLDATTVQAVWTPLPGASSVELRTRIAGTGTWSTVTTQSNAALGSKALTGLDTITKTYDVEFTPVASSGVRGTTLFALTDTLPLISNLTVSLANSTSLTATFIASGSATQVLLSATAQGASTPTTTITVAANASPATITGLSTESTSYTIRAAALGATGREGQVVTATYTGLTIPANPLFNLQAKDLASGQVSTWGEFGHTVSTRWPTRYATGGYMNKSYVSFNGTTNYLFASSRSFTAGTGGGLTYAVLVNFRAVNAWGRVMQGVQSSATSTDDFVIARVDTTTNMSFHARSVNYQTVNNAITNNEWAIYVYRYRASDKRLTITRNGVTILNTTNATWSMLDQVMNFSIAANIYGGPPSTPTSGNLAQIDMGALIMYPRALSDTEMTDLYNYVNNGLAV